MKHVLIVEDESILNSWMKKELDKVCFQRGVSCEVELATSLEEAKTKVRDQFYDLISTDGSYPNTPSGIMNKTAGVELIHWLEAEHYAGCVVFYSGNTGDVRALRESGASFSSFCAWEKSLSDDTDEGLVTISSHAAKVCELLQEHSLKNG